MSRRSSASKRSDPGDGGWAHTHTSPAGQRWAAAVAHLSAADRRMARLIATIGPCTLEPTGAAEPFTALVETIVYQQLTGKAAKTIFDRVCALFRGGRPAPRALLAAKDEALRGVGLSGPKIRSVRDLAQRVQSGELDLARLDALDAATLASRLLTVKGIGPWSVQMVLIFRLGRPDVWPVTDLGIRKGAQALWGLKELPAADELKKRGARLAPWRTIAAWYLWRSLVPAGRSEQPAKKPAAKIR